MLNKILNYLLAYTQDEYKGSSRLWRKYSEKLKKKQIEQKNTKKCKYLGRDILFKKRRRSISNALVSQYNCLRSRQTQYQEERSNEWL